MSLRASAWRLTACAGRRVRLPSRGERYGEGHREGHAHPPSRNNHHRQTHGENHHVLPRRFTEFPPRVTDRQQPKATTEGRFHGIEIVSMHKNSLKPLGGRPMEPWKNFFFSKFRSPTPPYICNTDQNPICRKYHVFSEEVDF